MRIGFLGLGNMGLPMARNLLGLGHAVTVYNRTPGKAKALIALGAMEARTVAEAVKRAEVAITMLSDDAAESAVVYGPEGLLQHLPRKAIHLCMSTIGVEASTELASAHAKADQGYVAAPVFGRADAASSRHIWIVTGGPEPQVNRCLPIFVALGRGHTRVGPQAALAHALKLGCDLLTLAMEEAVSKLLPLTEKAGLVPADYLRLLNAAIFRSHMVDGLGEVTPPPSFDPADLSLDLAANEMLLHAAKEAGVAIPVADLINARLQAAGSRGWGEQDLAALSEAGRTESGAAGAAVPEEKANLPGPPVSKPVGRKAPEPRRITDAKGGMPQREAQARPMPSPTGAAPAPNPAKAAESARPAGSPLMSPSSTFTAMNGRTRVTLDLNRTSHFEVIKGRVWAWSQGKRYETPWVHLSDVELAFNHVLFLLIQHHVLLRPEAVLDLRSTFGGGAKARVGENMELDVSRAAAPRLKELLGL